MESNGKAGPLLGGYRPPAMPVPLDPAAPRRVWPLRPYPAELASRSYQRLYLNPSPALLTRFEPDARQGGAADTLRQAMSTIRNDLSGTELGQVMRQQGGEQGAWNGA